MIHCNPHATDSLDPAGAIVQPYVYLTPGPITRGASRLVSLSYLGFATLRAYRDRDGFAWFVLSDAFKAIGKANTGTMRQRIKDPDDLSSVRVWVPNTVNPGASGFRVVQALSEGGMHAMLGVSKQAPSMALRKWLTVTAIPILRTV